MLSEGIPFWYGTQDGERVFYVSTHDSRFVTPEGIRIGDSVDRVRSVGGSEPREEPGWAHFSRLPSGWNAVLSVVTRDSEEPIQPVDAVQWLFLRSGLENPVDVAPEGPGAKGSGIAGCLGGIEVRPLSALGNLDYPGLTLRSSEPTESTVALDPGQTVEGYEIGVLAPPGCATGFRVQWQYETSATIMDEGPHLDLRGWKHHTSDWTDLEADGEGRLVVPVVTEEQASLFPVATSEALVEVVSREGGSRWSGLLGDDPTVGEYPSGVGLSAIRVRVLTQLGEGSWIALWTIHFEIAMGC